MARTMTRSLNKSTAVVAQEPVAGPAVALAPVVAAGQAVALALAPVVVAAAAVATVQAPVQEQLLPALRPHPVQALCQPQPPSQQGQARRSRRNPTTQGRRWRITAPWRLGQIGASSSAFQYSKHAESFLCRVTGFAICRIWQFSVLTSLECHRTRIKLGPGRLKGGESKPSVDDAPPDVCTSCLRTANRLDCVNPYTNDVAV